MKITLEDAEAWYRGDEDQNVSAHQVAVFYRGEMVNLKAAVATLTEKLSLATEALEDLVGRCDGSEGVRSDGSNIQTIRAHAILDTSAVMEDEI